MSIVLDHMHIPVRDMHAAARLYAEVFGREYKQPADWCTAIRLNDSLKLGFVEYIEPLTMHHYAFLVDDTEFDAILSRVQKAGVAYGSDPDKPTNGELNSYNGGRGFYFFDLDGHLIELLTSPDPGV